MASVPKRHPTGFVPETLTARVIDFAMMGGLGLRGMASAADVIAAECRFNFWFASEVKKMGLPAQTMLDFLERDEQAHELAVTAMARFATERDESRLCDALDEVARRLNDRTIPASSPTDV